MTPTLCPIFRFHMGVNLQTENFLSENYQEICQVQQRDAAAFRVLPCQDTGQAQGCSV